MNVTSPSEPETGIQGGASTTSESDTTDLFTNDFSKEGMANMTDLADMNMNMTGMGEDDLDMGLQVEQKISMTENGIQRLELNITYGNSTIRQIFEVRDGELEQMPEMETPLGGNATVGGNATDMEDAGKANLNVTDTEFFTDGERTPPQESSGGENPQNENIAAFANGAQGPAGSAGSREGVRTTPQESSGRENPQDGNNLASGNGAQGQAGSAGLRMRSRRSLRRG